MNATRANHLALLTGAAVVLILALVFPASRGWIVGHGGQLLDDLARPFDMIAAAFTWLGQDVIAPLFTAAGNLIGAS